MKLNLVVWLCIFLSSCAVVTTEGSVSSSSPKISIKGLDKPLLLYELWLHAPVAGFFKINPSLHHNLMRMKP